MARIQILELPTVYRANGDDETPFAVVIDQADEETFQRFAYGEHDALKAALGARAVLVFADTIEIPANEVTVADGQTVQLRVEPDFTTFREKLENEVRAAQARLSQAVTSR
ncbi:hypothetical protein [Streptomyces griseosporeus]|uniref:hypothetical protein n=1 Tax=Streptomyces griseosporeus TaxID=1910 RepID=UPI0036F915FC